MAKLPPAEGARRALPCELVSWERFYELSLQLARTIHTAWFRPEIIVAIGRGGYFPARILSDYLDVFDLASVKIEHYHGAERQKLARIRYPLTAEVEGRRVLLVDDVTDSGDTFEVASAHLRARGEPAALKTAVLHHKNVSDFEPDYFAEEVVDWHWIVYPWALIEDLSGFLREMRSPPASAEAFDAFLREQHGIRVSREMLEEVLSLARG
ncbi:MAG: phosphoribosyltransferase [Gammaproteobacteria bacterium]|jgi:hypoxanthine phosphoribosyltransferase